MPSGEPACQRRDRSAAASRAARASAERAAPRATAGTPQRRGALRALERASGTPAPGVAPAAVRQQPPHRARGVARRAGASARAASQARRLRPAPRQRAPSGPPAPASSGRGAERQACGRPHPDGVDPRAPHLSARASPRARVAPGCDRPSHCCAQTASARPAACTRRCRRFVGRARRPSRSFTPSRGDPPRGTQEVRRRCVHRSQSHTGQRHGSTRGPAGSRAVPGSVAPRRLPDSRRRPLRGPARPRAASRARAGSVPARVRAASCRAAHRAPPTTKENADEHQQVHLHRQPDPDPELRELPSGTARVRAARRGRRRWAAPASPATSLSACSASPARPPPSILAKGWLVAVDGRLEFREWEHRRRARSATTTRSSATSSSSPPPRSAEPSRARAGAAGAGSRSPPRRLRGPRPSPGGARPRAAAMEERQMSTPSNPQQQLTYLRMLAGSRAARPVPRRALARAGRPDAPPVLPGRRRSGRRSGSITRLAPPQRRLRRRRAARRRHPRRPRRDRRSHLVWVESDDPSTAQRLLALPAPADAWSIASGTPGHLQLYWRLTGRVRSTSSRARNRRLALALAGDPACTDAARILRPPGTLNHKHDPPRPVELLASAPVLTARPRRS